MSVFGKALQDAAANDKKLAGMVQKSAKNHKKELKKLRRDLQDLKKASTVISKEMQTLIHNQKLLIDPLGTGELTGNIARAPVEQRLKFMAAFGLAASEANKEFAGKYKDRTCADCQAVGTYRLSIPFAMTELSADMNFKHLIDDEAAVEFQVVIKEKIGVLIDSFEGDGKTTHICNDCRVKAIAEIKEHIDTKKEILEQNVHEKLDLEKRINDLIKVG